MLQPSSLVRKLWVWTTPSIPPLYSSGSFCATVFESSSPFVGGFTRDSNPHIGLHLNHTVQKLSFRHIVQDHGGNIEVRFWKYCTVEFGYI